MDDIETFEIEGVSLGVVLFGVFFLLALLIVLARLIAMFTVVSLAPLGWRLAPRTHALQRFHIRSHSAFSTKRAA
jgi:hypothetical protein